MKKDEVKTLVQRAASSLRSHNFSESYIKDVALLTERWANTGLLEGTGDVYIAMQLAKLLENQRLFNEEKYEENANIPADANVDKDAFYAQWRRVSIPAVRRIFGPGFLPYQLVSVQAIPGPSGYCYETTLDEKTNGVEVAVRTRMIRLPWEPVSNRLDAEASALATFAENYAQEITGEIIGDLMRVAGSKAKDEFKDPKYLTGLIDGMCAYVGSKINGNDANWVVVSPAVAKILQEAGFENPKERTCRLFEYEKMGNNVLVGYKHPLNHYYAGYFYCPYRPFEARMGWQNEKFKEEGHLFARYGKRLSNANFYGLLTVENLPEKTPLDEKAESEE